MPAYWPWRQAIRTYARDRGVAELFEATGDGLAELLEVVRELRSRIPEPLSAPAEN